MCICLTGSLDINKHNSVVLYYLEMVYFAIVIGWLYFSKNDMATFQINKLSWLLSKRKKLIADNSTVKK